MPGARDDRHQHGRPRHRHSARRQRRLSAQGLDRRGNAGRARARSGADSPRRAERLQADVKVKQAGGARGRRPLRARAPSVTRAAASTTSCAAVPAVRATPAAPSSISSLEDDLMRIFGSERMDSVLQTLGLQEGEAITHPVDEQVAGDGAEEGRGAQLRHPQADPQVRRRDERPAQGHLRAAPRHHGRGGRLRHRRRPAPAGRARARRAQFIPEKAYAEQWDYDRR